MTFCSISICMGILYVGWYKRLSGICMDLRFKCEGISETLSILLACTFLTCALKALTTAVLSLLYLFPPQHGEPYFILQFQPKTSFLNETAPISLLAMLVVPSVMQQAESNMGPLIVRTPSAAASQPLTENTELKQKYLWSDQMNLLINKLKCIFCTIWDLSCLINAWNY